MISESLSVIASAVFAAGILMVRLSLSKVHYGVASLFINLFGFIFFSILMLVTGQEIDFFSFAPIFFLLAGVFSPGLVRYTYYRGIFYLGASLNASIFATWPLFAFLLSILLLKEASTIGTYIGGIIIIIGIIFLNLSISRDLKKPNLKYVSSSFLAAIFAAIATILRKEGLNILPEPILGVWISYLAAILTSLFIVPKNSYKSIFNIPKKLFLAGFCLCFAWLTFFYALKFGDASTVSALMNLEAIFILFFSKIFLRTLEEVGNLLIISTILITIGASLIFLY